MLWLSTLSVFLPSLTSSSIVWARPHAGHAPNSVASSNIFFMNILPCLDGSSREESRRSWRLTLREHHPEKRPVILVERFRSSNYMLRHSGAPPHIGCCRCAHRIVPISGKPEIGCGEPGTHNHGAWGYGFRARVLRTRPGMTPTKIF